jgi:hypothetical protein
VPLSQLRPWEEVPRFFPGPRHSLFGDGSVPPQRQASRHTSLIRCGICATIASPQCGTPSNVLSGQFLHDLAPLARGALYLVKAVKSPEEIRANMRAQGVRSL